MAHKQLKLLYMQVTSFKYYLTLCHEFSRSFAIIFKYPELSL